MPCQPYVLESLPLTQEVFNQRWHLLPKKYKKEMAGNCDASLYYPRVFNSFGLEEKRVKNIISQHCLYLFIILEMAQLGVKCLVGKEQVYC